MNRARAILWVSITALCGCAASTDRVSSATRGNPSSAAPAPVQIAREDVVIDASKPLAAISSDALGINLGIWYAVDARRFASEVASLGPRLLRWPGGSTADDYQWRHHTECDTRTNRPEAAYARASTFDRFMRDLVIPGRYAVAITVNYGSNETCTDGGDPREAAAWVAHAKRKGYDRYIRFWTVGNEEFGAWEYDRHAQPHDPRTYAAALSGPQGYYALMKAADPSARIGVMVTGSPSAHRHWDPIVLAGAPYDFVEAHFYPQQPGHEGDRFLLDRAPREVSRLIASVRRELAAAGRPGIPILLGEFNSVAYAPGKQTVSIVNALFTGMAFGEALDSGVAAAAWWFGVGGDQNCRNNDSPSLYGWQNFGGYDLLAASTRSAWNGCGRGPVVPEGTVFPSGDAFQLVRRFAAQGRRMLAVRGGRPLPDLRVYADALASGGYAAMLFNLSETTRYVVRVRVEHADRTSFRAATLTYDKAIYDASRRNVWRRPIFADRGTGPPTVLVALPPWSLTVLTLK